MDKACSCQAAVLVLACALHTSCALAFAPAGGFVAGLHSAHAHAIAQRQSMAPLSLGSTLARAAGRRTADSVLNLMMTTYEDYDDLDIPVLTSNEQLEDVINKASAAGHGTMILFKKEVCRKCAALAPKFQRLPQKYTDRRMIWVMVNADKLDKAQRTKLGLKTVPAIEFWGKNGDRSEHYEALGSIADVMDHICGMAAKHSEMLEPGSLTPTLKGIGFDAKMSVTGAH